MVKLEAIAVKTCSAISLSGGQGKTTTIFFTALLLAQQGYKVLAVDADPQANLTFYLNYDVQPDEPSLFEVLTREVKVEDGIYETQYENLFVIPADTTPERDTCNSPHIGLKRPCISIFSVYYSTVSSVEKRIGQAMISSKGKGLVTISRM